MYFLVEIELSVLITVSFSSSSLLKVLKFQEELLHFKNRFACEIKIKSTIKPSKLMLVPKNDKTTIQ